MMRSAVWRTSSSRLAARIATGTTTSRRTTSSSSTTHITSRRAYNRLQQQQANSNKPSSVKETTTKSKTDADTAGWPASVRYSAYAVAATLGPYSILWGVANTPMLHDALEESHRAWLRRYFGVAEHDQEMQLLEKQAAATTVTRTIQKKLPLEPDLRQRIIQHEQAALDETELDVKVTLYDSNAASNTDTGINSTMTIQVPARVLARASDLREYVAKAAAGSVSESSIIGIDFLSSKQQQELATEVVDGSNTLYSDDDAAASDTERDSPTAPDLLLKNTTIYSSWHHHPALDTVTAAANTTPLAQQSIRSSDDYYLRQHLESEIALLEAEMYQRNHASMRDMDDIQHELSTKRAQLRRLKWKRWVPW